MKKYFLLIFLLSFCFPVLVSADSSVNESSDNIWKDNLFGAASALSAGNGFMSSGMQNMARCGKECYSCCVIGAILLNKGGKSYSQSGANLGTAFSADYTATATNAYGNTSEMAQQNAEAMEIKRSLGDANAKFESLLKEMEAGKHPLTYDPKTKTFTDPFGNKYKSSDLESDSALASLGVSKATLDEASSKSRDIEKSVLKDLAGKNSNAAKAPFGEENIGTGTGSIIGDSQENNPSANAGIDRAQIQREVASAVVGLSKNYNGNPIGVSIDSLFLMMSRRYDLKEKQDSFLDH